MKTMNPQEPGGAMRRVSSAVTRRAAAYRLLSATLCALLTGSCCLGCARSSGDEIEWQANESVESEGWRVTVLSVSALHPDSYRRPLDGHMFVAVQLKLENNSPHIRYVMPEQQITLLDGEGRAYQLDRQAAVIAARALHWLIPEGEFPPGAVAEGATSYQVPLGARDLRCVFRTALHPGAPRVTFALGDVPKP
jgi:hypothetical protein